MSFSKVSIDDLGNTRLNLWKKHLICFHNTNVTKSNIFCVGQHLKKKEKKIDHPRLQHIFALYTEGAKDVWGQVRWSRIDIWFIFFILLFIYFLLLFLFYFFIFFFCSFCVCFHFAFIFHFCLFSFLNFFI